MSDRIAEIRAYVADEMRFGFAPPLAARAIVDLLVAVDDREREIERLRDLIDRPSVGDFLESVRLEAAHQKERWGAQHDATKEPPDWYWVVGHLAGKAVHAAITGDRVKALHHTISSAAVLANWHAALTGASG